MANTIITKNSSTASSVPTSGDLVQGELAVNVTDKRLFTENAGGTVVEVGTNPSSLTLPNGTANGVAYLNGSKVVTSGSALTFDGSQFAVNSNNGIQTSHSGCTLELIGRGDLGYSIVGTDTDHPIAFRTNNTERMRLTSTGLGIGTSSPLSPLNIQQTGDTLTNGLTLTRTGANRGTIFLNASDDTLRISRGTTESLVISSAGNLGLGVTPSDSWWASTKSIGVGRLGNGIFGSTGDDEVNIGANVINTGSGTYIYGATDTASLYRQVASQHVWYQAASGTAGAALTLSEAMRINASGNVGIGTSSPIARTDVASTSTSQAVFRALNSGANWSQVLVGYNGTSVNYYDADTQIFRNGATQTERARIDSSGNLLVGTTSPAPTSGGISLTAGGYIYTSRGTTTAASQILFRNPNGTVGSVQTSGTSTSYLTASDYRLKNSIAPMTGALAKVQALKPVTYKWNADGADGEGFIAHELAEVCPQAVAGEKDAVDTDGNPIYQGIDTSFLVATLTAAIQELKAEFDAYKASHP